MTKKPTDPPTTSIPEPSPVTRRDFLVRAGQLGAAASVLVPGLRHAGLAEGFASVGTTRMMGSSEAATAATTAAISDLYSGLRWRMLGPFRGGRVASATGVPSRPNEFYFGAVNGGVWKSIDAGRVWTPVFDSQPVASIGAITVAASAPDTVYVGSGESSLRDSVGYGNGMYKSTDAGKSWTHIGLDETHHIMRIAIDPKNPNVLFVAAIGHLYAANPERGIFRSKDGGKTWQSVLHKSDDIGAADVVIVIRPTRGSSTRRCGMRGGPPGTATRPPTGRAAASSSRRMAAIPGRSSPRGYRTESAGWGWPFRPPIPSACMPWWIAFPTREVSSAPTMRARHGR